MNTEAGKSLFKHISFCVSKNPVKLYRPSGLPRNCTFRGAVLVNHGRRLRGMTDLRCGALLRSSATQSVSWSTYPGHPLMRRPKTGAVGSHLILIAD